MLYHVKTRNRILLQFPTDALARFGPHLSRVRLRRRAILEDVNESVDTILFIERGLVALFARTGGEGMVGVGILGNRGMVGISALLGTSRAPYRCMVEVEGEALRMGVSHLRGALEDPAVRQPLLDHVQSLLVDRAQSALCNVRHDLVQRLSRGLLRMHDLLDGDVIPLTHSLMSAMLGVRRAGVTAALGHLEDIGAIAKRRGIITIIDRILLERCSCECYRAVTDCYARHYAASERDHMPGRMKSLPMTGPHAGA